MSTSAKGILNRLSGKRRLLGAHPSVAFTVLLCIAALSLGDLMEIIPIFAPLVASSFFPFFHEIHDLLAAGLVIYAAYKHHSRLGITAIIVYVTVHIPYFIIRFPENAPELLRILFSAFGATVGIWLISRLYKNEEQMEVSRETLRQSEGKYRGLVGNIRLGIFRSTPGPTGRFLEVNRAMEEITGYSREELLRMNVSDLYLHPEERQAVIEEISSAHGKITKEMNFRKKAGDEIVVADTKTPVKDDTGKTLYFDGVLEDTTERKLAEKRIAHLTAVLKSVRNVSQLITRESNRESLIQQICDLLVQREGYKKAWILLLDGNRNFVAAAGHGFDENTSAFLKQLETGNYPVCIRKLLIQGQPLITYDQPGKRHEGCVLTNEHSRHGVFRCKLEYEGKLYGVLGVTVPSEAVFEKDEQVLFMELCADIAFALVKIEGEEALRDSETRYRSLFTSMLEGFAYCRMLFEDERPHDFVYLEVNARFEELTGLHDVVGKKVSEIIPGIRKTNPELFDTYGRVALTGKPEKLETYLPALDIWFSIAVYSPRKEYFIAVFDVITERKKMQAQLIALDRLATIGQLVSGIAHEINNPLTSVIGFSELLLQRDLPDDIKADIKIVNDEANRSFRIVKNLLTFARKQPEGKAPVDINEQIRRVLNLRDHEQKVSNIRVITHLTSDLPRTMGNASQLQQVFFNIIVNGEQAMLETRDRGTMTITTERVGNIVKACIADNGPGIKPENMKRLFTPFFTTKEIGKGTGLGLSICHGIITEHGGKMYAESEHGKGACFVVELPFIPKEVATEGQQDNKHSIEGSR